jgi:phage-related tail protein
MGRFHNQNSSKYKGLNNKHNKTDIYSKITNLEQKFRKGCINVVNMINTIKQIEVRLKKFLTYKHNKTNRSATKEISDTPKYSRNAVEIFKKKNNKI